MPLVDSLLTAIMRADGDALVLHVGERPYVVTTIGNVDLSKTILTLDVVAGMLAQLLPGELLGILSEVGAVEHQLQPPSAMRDAFTVVAARGGDDIWIEIRRKRAVVRTTAVAVPEVASVQSQPVALPDVESPPTAASPVAIPTSEASTTLSAPIAGGGPDTLPATPIPAPTIVEPATVVAAEVPAAENLESGPPEIAAPVDQPTQFSAPDDRYEIEPLELEQVAEALAAEDVKVSDVVMSEATRVTEATPAPPTSGESTNPEFATAPAALVGSAARSPVESGPSDQVELGSEPDATPVPFASVGDVAAEPVRLLQPEPAVVVPLPRLVRVEASPRSATKEHSIERLLALAAACSGEQVYVTSQSRPFLRVEGEMRPVDSEPVFSAPDVEAIILELMPESARESHRRGDPAEWSAEVEHVGRIRCATFRDHRGPGVVFQLTTSRPISAEQLGLTREIQSLATEPEGLVVVTGPRGGGKSTLVAALVDLVNKQHSVSVITIERQIRIVHDNRLALVSQREVRGTGADAMSVIRAALRENPDVLVLEDLKSPDIVQLALDAAGTGRLVMLTLTAGSTVSALSRIVESFPPASRKAAQSALAERLRGAVSQVVLRKTGGGRIAARELLLASSTVATLVADGQFTQLTAALDSGRRPGLLSLNHVLASLVKSGAVDASEAYRKADNRTSLLGLLEHNGVDTSLLARLA